MRVHLVYPQMAGVHVAPWTIGSRLLSALVEAGHVVSWSDWDDCRAPQSCDLLLGHPHPEPERSYELAARGAARRVAICPVNSDPRGKAWLGEMRARGMWDHLLAICGPEWQSEIDLAWPCTRLDMAIDPVFWAPVERFDTATNRVLYVGCQAPCKGTDRLARLSDVAGERLDFCHIGPGQIGGRVRDIGFAPNGSWRSVAAMFPRIISMGRFDANPTVILEGVAMGMTAFATRGAGWGADLVHRLPDGDTPAELEECVRLLLETPLEPRVEVAQGYSWAKFVGVVMSAVNSAVG